jgi:negative regulator of sigma E activity
LGEALELETFVQVRWPWLTLIASQTFLSIVLVVVTMVKTLGAGIEAIKTASLPALFAINTGNRAQLEAGLATQKPMEEYKAVQKKGKGVMECLTWTDDGWLLHRQEDSSSSEAEDEHGVEPGNDSL